MAVDVMLNVGVVPNKKIQNNIPKLDIMVQWKFEDSCLSYPFVAYIMLQNSINIWSKIFFFVILFLPKRGCRWMWALWPPPRM